MVNRNVLLLAAAIQGPLSLWLQGCKDEKDPKDPKQTDSDNNDAPDTNAPDTNAPDNNQRDNQNNQNNQGVQNNDQNNQDTQNNQGTQNQDTQNQDDQNEVSQNNQDESQTEEYVADHKFARQPEVVFKEMVEDNKVKWDEKAEHLFDDTTTPTANVFLMSSPPQEKKKSKDESGFIQADSNWRYNLSGWTLGEFRDQFHRKMDRDRDDYHLNRSLPAGFRTSHLERVIDGSQHFVFDPRHERDSNSAASAQILTSLRMNNERDGKKNVAHVVVAEIYAKGGEEHYAASNPFNVMNIFVPFHDTPEFLAKLVMRAFDQIMMFNGALKSAYRADDKQTVLYKSQTVWTADENMPKEPNFWRQYQDNRDPKPAVQTDTANANDITMSHIGADLPHNGLGYDKDTVEFAIEACIKFENELRAAIKQLWKTHVETNKFPMGHTHRPVAGGPLQGYFVNREIRTPFVTEDWDKQNPKHHEGLMQILFGMDASWQPKLLALRQNLDTIYYGTEDYKVVTGALIEAKRTDPATPVPGVGNLQGHHLNAAGGEKLHNYCPAGWKQVYGRSNQATYPCGPTADRTINDPTGNFPLNGNPGPNQVMCLPDFVYDRLAHPKARAFPTGPVENFRQWASRQSNKHDISSNYMKPTLARRNMLDDYLIKNVVVHFPGSQLNKAFSVAMMLAAYTSFTNCFDNDNRYRSEDTEFSLARPTDADRHRSRERESPKRNVAYLKAEWCPERLTFKTNVKDSKKSSFYRIADSKKAQKMKMVPSTEPVESVPTGPQVMPKKSHESEVQKLRQQSNQ